MGEPDPVILAKAGTVRGTLMADALRPVGMLSPFRAALCLHLLETSPSLRAAQAERLLDATRGASDRAISARSLRSR